MPYFGDRCRSESGTAMEVARWTLAAADPGLAPDEVRRRRVQADRATAALRRALFPPE